VDVNSVWEFLRIVAGPFASCSNQHSGSDLQISVSDQLAKLTPSVDPSVAAVLADFAPVFAPVDGLPPKRAFDHSIPLVAGAKPVYIRPYRYPPALKDEIEKQVQDMLDKGLI